jgi:hypothetical protein
MRIVSLVSALLFFSASVAQAADAKPPAAETTPPEGDLLGNPPSISKQQADMFIQEGKRAMVESNDNPRRSVDAAVSFSKALKYYETTDQTDTICDLEANIFWCKKRMNIDDVKAFVAQKSGDKTVAAALAKVNEVATKEVSVDKADEYFARAEKFAVANPDNFAQISVRYFEVAKRFVGTPTGIKAHELSMSAHEKEVAATKAEQEAQRATLFSKPTDVNNKVKQTPVPSNEVQKSSIATIRSLYKADFAKKKPNQKNNLMIKIHGQAVATKDDPTMQYSLLTLAIDLGMECQNYVSVLESCDLMAKNFSGVDAKAYKKTVFAKTKNSTTAAIIKLLDDPQNGEANTSVGKYFSYDEQRWDLGIPLFMHGADAELKSMADMEMLKPEGVAQQVELGDHWYDIGKKGSKSTKEGPWSRALYWYQLAGPKITGISKERIAKRLDEIDAILPMTNLNYDNLTTKQWDRLKGNVVTAFVGKDRKDIGLTLTAGAKYRIVPHPTDLWQWNSYYSSFSSSGGNGQKEVNYKGLVQTYTSGGIVYSYNEGGINDGALVMQIESGPWMKPGLIEGDGRVYLGPYSRYSYGLGGKGEIRCKILTVTDE